VRTSDLLRAAIAACFALTALACSSRLAAPSYPLSNVVVRSADGTLAARAPEGWTAQAPGALPPGMLAVLRSPDGSATLRFREISLDRLTGQRVRGEGLALLARLSAAFRSGAVPGDGLSLREEDLGERKVCGYEWTKGEVWSGVLVTMIGARAYECEASGPPAQAVRTGEAQRAFLASVVTSIRG
jgi:hypothetical protein